MKPNETDSPSGISELMPMNIPVEFYKDDNQYAELAHAWFFRGIPKTGLRGKSDVSEVYALRHMATIMHSWEPKHEDKIAAVAYLMSQWFDLA